MLMVDFNDHPAANHYVRAFWQYLQTHPAPKNLQPVAGMTCMGFLTNSDDAGRLDLSALSEKILGLAQESLTAAPRPGKTVEIPICYDLSMAPDLEHFAKHCGISTKEVVKRHSSGEYVAQLIGFLPGFAYLGGLDPSLSMPRLATPRPKVPAGALGIAGEQCALYPTASPGGWNLIGRTPIRLFNSAKNEPCAIGLGDRVRFVEISKVEFERQWASR
jgi:KipI family sensor histidine kinase inhibitor